MQPCAHLTYVHPWPSDLQQKFEPHAQTRGHNLLAPSLDSTKPLQNWPHRGWAGNQAEDLLGLPEGTASAQKQRRWQWRWVRHHTVFACSAPHAARNGERLAAPNCKHHPVLTLSLLAAWLDSQLHDINDADTDIQLPNQTLS